MIDYSNIPNMDCLFRTFWEHDSQRIILKYRDDRQVLTMTADQLMAQAEAMAAVLEKQNLQHRHRRSLQ